MDRLIEVPDLESQAPAPIEFIPQATLQLRIMMAYYRSVLPIEQYNALVADTREVFERYTKELSLHPAGVERAQIAHQLLNIAVANGTAQVKPSCSKGCSACCHLEVEITRDEGELLADLVAKGFIIDRTKLEIQAARERQSPEWATAPREANRCVFLGVDQTCQIYEDRPSTCRKVVVTSDPVECASVTGKPTPILIPLAEIALSAAASLQGNTARSLSKNLLLTLRKREVAQGATLAQGAEDIPGEPPQGTASVAPSIAIIC